MGSTIWMYESLGICIFAKWISYLPEIHMMLPTLISSRNNYDIILLFWQGWDGIFLYIILLYTYTTYQYLGDYNENQSCPSCQCGHLPLPVHTPSPDPQTCCSVLWNLFIVKQKSDLLQLIGCRSGTTCDVRNTSIQLRKISVLSRFSRNICKCFLKTINLHNVSYQNWRVLLPMYLCYCSIDKDRRWVWSADTDENVQCTFLVLLSR